VKVTVGYISADRRYSMTLKAGLGVVVLGVVAVLGTSLMAQQAVKVPSVITPHGFIVEEVRVGQSCVVIVSRGGPPSEHVAAVPCTR
jgi:hypothetical protein